MSPGPPGAPIMIHWAPVSSPNDLAFKSGESAEVTTRMGVSISCSTVISRAIPIGGVGPINMSVRPSRNGFNAPGNNPLDSRTSMLGWDFLKSVRARGMILMAASGETQT